MPSFVPKLIFSVLLMAFLSPLFAADKTTSKLYQVNIIVFKTTSAQTLTPENYYTPIQFKSDQNAITLSATAPSDPQSDDSFTLLPESQFALDKELKILQNNSHYQILLALAWWQPFESGAKAETIKLLAKPAYDRFGYLLDDDQLRWISSQDDLFNSLHWQAAGTLKISLARYFNLALDLQLQQPMTNSMVSLGQNQTFTPFKIFELKQSIRARSNKLYYFDHPGFGVIVKITPYQPPTTGEIQNAS